jgi:hypothetical protein
MDAVVSGNVCVFLPGPTLSFAERSFFRIDAPNGPNNILISGNNCRTFEASRDTFFVNVRMSSTQVQSATNLVVTGNSGVGLSAGVVFEFPAARNFDKSTITNNTFALTNKPSGIPAFKNKAIVLDGAAAGTVGDLTTDFLPYDIYSNLSPLVQSRVLNLYSPLNYGQGEFDFSLGDGTNEFTASFVNAKYIKLGNWVHCTIDYSWSDKGTASGALFCNVGNLPFDVSGDDLYVPITIRSASTDYFDLKISEGLDFGRIHINSSTAGALVSALPASGRLLADFSYLIS